MANDFEKFSAVNKQRAMRWHRGGLDEWSVTDWSNAFAGEAGELCNAVKKFRRVEDRIQGGDGDTPQPRDVEAAVRAIQKEIGDVYAYLDLLAQRFSLDMWTCVASTFDQISVRENMPERAPVVGQCAHSGQLLAIRIAAQTISENRDFVVHSNDATSDAIKTILSESRQALMSMAAEPKVGL